MEENFLVAGSYNKLLYGFLYKHDEKTENNIEIKEEDENEKDNQVNDKEDKSSEENKQDKSSEEKSSDEPDKVEEDGDEDDEEKKTGLIQKFLACPHTSALTCIATSGNICASGSTDEIIKVYNLNTRKEIGSLHEHTGKITALEFYNKTHLLSASEDGNIVIYRTNDWEVLKKLKAHKNGVRHISVHPTGRMALSIGEKDGMLKMWNLLVGKEVYKYKYEKDHAELVSWSPCGNFYLAVFPKTIAFYSAMETTKNLSAIQVGYRLNSVVWLSKNMIAFGGEEKTIEIWKKVESESEIYWERVETLYGHLFRIKSLSLLPMEPAEKYPLPLLFSVSSDGIIFGWDVNDIENKTNEECLISVLETDDRIISISATNFPKFASVNNKRKNQDDQVNYDDFKTSSNKRRKQSRSSHKKNSSFDFDSQPVDYTFMNQPKKKNSKQRNLLLRKRLNKN